MVINLNLSDGRRFDITNEDEEWSWSGQRRGSFSFTLSLRRSWCIFLDVVTSAWLHPACKPSCRACSREQTTQQQQAAGPCEQQTSACICALWSQHTHKQQQSDALVAAGWQHLTFVLAMHSGLSEFHCLGWAERGEVLEEGCVCGRW